MEPRLLTIYKEQTVPALKTKFGVKNTLAIPKLQKIVVNMGVGDAIQDIKALESAQKTLETIAGQKSEVRRSKIAISNFKLREGMPVGCKVTLRAHKMYEFLDRFINICLPRIRDFNGVSRNSFDKQGNYSIGISDQSIFPEIETGAIQRTQGMDITLVFNQGSKEINFELLRLLGMPFSKS